jgi:hypothetical protein
VDIQKTIDRCDRVVQMWSQREATIETVEDFARALGLQVEFKLVPLVSVFETKTEEPPSEEPDAENEPQYELFNEMSAEDKYAMKSWRSNNGL